MSHPILKVSDVTVQFGALKAVERVTLAVAPGERRALIGPNGAGKTTLFNAITGGVRVASGRIALDGRDITAKSSAARAHLGIARTFQITNLFARLTVSENMRLAVRGLSASKFAMLGRDTLAPALAERTRHALAVSRLHGREGILVKDMSYGEQRQLEVAMALAATPRLLLLDEPAAGLSPAERTFLADIIRGLPRDLAIILIEHDMDLALGLVDEVTVMQNGRIIADGKPETIRTNAVVQDVYLGTRHGVSATPAMMQGTDRVAND